MFQQLFKFDNKFHNFYYKKIISKNLKITPQIFSETIFFFHIKGGNLSLENFKNIFKKEK